MFLILLGLLAFFTVGRTDIFTEEIIEPGPHSAKILVISLEGIVEDRMADELKAQLRSAEKDTRIRGLIIRVNSPGGTIFASDRIYNEILKYKNGSGDPVVALMEAVAASGGYYLSLAADSIIAQPTTITGSIGVIMGHFVVSELLEEKLGITPVVIKSGPKKDWPSPFQPVTDEQKRYLADKLIMPAYERFVELVALNRPDLSITDVRRLADGSIYNAAEASENKLIDEVGYLDRAKQVVLSKAGIEDAQLVGYRRPFSLSGILGMKKPAAFLDKNTIYELITPRVLYLWTADQ